MTPELMTALPHCSDCGEEHAGHHDRTAMTRTGGGLYVQPCDPSVGAGKSFGGTVVERSVRTAAEAYYRDCRRHHEDVCISTGDGV